MKGGTRAAVAIGVGYMLGRRRADTVRGDLVDAGKAAAVAAVTNRVDALTGSLHDRAESIRNPAAAPAWDRARLARLADHSRLHPPQSPQLADDCAQMILNAAYLLANDADGDFAAALSDLDARHPDVRIEVTGPWPPYSFAGLPEPDPR